MGNPPTGVGSRQGHGPTGGAGAFGRHEDLALLLAGRLAQEALVLEALPIGAAHGNIVVVALGGTHRGAPWLVPGQAAPTSGTGKSIYSRKRLSSFSAVLPSSLTLLGNHSKTHKAMPRQPARPLIRIEKEPSKLIGQFEQSDQTSNTKKR